MNTSTPIRRGLGINAGLDAGLARDLAIRCEQLGYHSLWSNDEPAFPALETLADFAAAAPQLELGVGVLPLDRHQPVRIAAEITRLGLDPTKLWIGVGSGQLRAPIHLVQQAVAELRELLPEGTRIVVAAMRPRMCHLGGAIADGVLLNWMLPAQAAQARRWAQQGADQAGRAAPILASYVRVAVGPGARQRLRDEERPTAMSMRPIVSISRPWTFPSAASAWPHRRDRRCSTGSRRTTPRSTSRSHGCSQTRMQPRCPPPRLLRRRDTPLNSRPPDPRPNQDDGRDVVCVRAAGDRLSRDRRRPVSARSR